VSWRLPDTSDDERRVAALRHSIRRAGAGAGFVRRAVGTALSCASVLAFPILVYLVGGEFLHLEPDVDPLPGTASLAIVGALALSSISLALLAGRCYRTARADGLGRELAGLSEPQRAQVLLPLAREEGDTRKIVRPLIRRFRLPAEVAPAGLPGGRGSEVRP
jgi:hypothetical protein